MLSELLKVVIKVETYAREKHLLSCMSYGTVFSSHCIKRTVHKRVAWFVWQGWFGSERLGTTRVHTLAFSEPSRVEPSQTE